MERNVPTSGNGAHRQTEKFRQLHQKPCGTKTTVSGNIETTENQLKIMCNQVSRDKVNQLQLRLE